MKTERGAANARALERIVSVEPRWTAVRPACEAIGLADRVLLHAGPPLPDPTRPPPPMLNSAVLACLYEGWARNEAEAEELIAHGAVKLEPRTPDRQRCCLPGRMRSLQCLHVMTRTLSPALMEGEGSDPK